MSRGTSFSQPQQQLLPTSSKFDPFEHNQATQIASQAALPPSSSVPSKFLQGGRGDQLRRNASITSTSTFSSAASEEEGGRSSTTTSNSSNSGGSSNSRRSGSSSRTAATTSTNAIEEELALLPGAARTGTMPTASGVARSDLRKQPAERIKIVRQASLFADENDPVHHPVSSPSQHQQQQRTSQEGMMAGRAQGVNQSAGVGAGAGAAGKGAAGVSYAAAAAASAAGGIASSPSSKRDSSASATSTAPPPTAAGTYSASPIARPSSGEYTMSSGGGRSTSRERGEGLEGMGKGAANGGASHVQSAVGMAGSGAGAGAYRQTLSQRSHSHGPIYGRSAGTTTTGGGGSAAGGESMTASLSRGLETMHENEQAGNNTSGTGSSTFAPLSGGGVHEHYPPQAASSSSSAAAGPRHRSASSAAALEQQGRQAWDSHSSYYADPSGGAGSGGAGYYPHQYGGNAQPPHANMPPQATYQRSHSAAVLEAQHRYARSPSVSAAQQHHQRHHDPGLDSYGGRAFSPQQLSGSSGSSSASAFGSKVEYYDGDTPYAGRSLSRADASSAAAAAAAAMPSNSSPFYSHFGTFAVPPSGGSGMGGEDGSESRRHSIAVSSPPVQAGIAEPRRAVGFNVSGPATSSSGRSSGAVAASQQHGGGVFGGGGSSALSMDDLASDLGNFAVSERVPSSHAAMQGAHAASMPGFTSTHSSLYGHNSPAHSATGRTFGGAMWDALGREGESRESAGVRSRFRAASMAQGEAQNTVTQQ
jgi:hypothetical protein